MNEHLTQLLHLVQELEPTLDGSTILMDIPVRDGRRHLWGRHDVAATAMVMSLDEAAALPTCTDCAESASLEELLNQISVPALRQALNEVYYLRAISYATALGSDVRMTHGHVIGTIGELWGLGFDVINLYSSASDQVHGILTGGTASHHGYEQVVMTELDRVNNELATVQRDSISGEQARTLLYNVAVNRYGVRDDGTNVRVVLAPCEIRLTTPDDPRFVDQQFAFMAQLAFVIGTTILTEEVQEIPTWVHEALKLADPTMLRSQAYPPKGVDDLNVEFATRLWTRLEDEPLGSFDTAYQAAAMLQH